MLDINYIRENTEKVKQAATQKRVDPSIVDELLEIDISRRKLISEVEKIRFERNNLNDKLKVERTPELMSQSTDLKNKLQELEPRLDDAEAVYAELILKIPNVPLESVPFGKDESENVVSKTVGTPTTFDFTPKDHLEIGQDLDIIDTDTAAKVSGSRFAYLKGDGAMLEFALIQYVTQTLTNKDIIKKIADSVKDGYSAKPFTAVVPPVFIKTEVFKRMARLTDEDKTERYQLPLDDQYLVGSAEHTLGPIHMDQTLPEKLFPIRYIGFSTAFRREAGSYGKDTRGIIRVHQFDKLEMESFTVPEDSETEQDFLIATQEYLISGLAIPYQVISICTGDMGKPDARQVDINCWMPGQGKYRETNTSDLMTDFQSRRLETKVKRDSGETQYVHMNDATAIAVGRIIVAILENFQQADGSVKVPDVLVPFMGKDVITRG
jgi:seryl-tRNA synthetase